MPRRPASGQLINIMGQEKADEMVDSLLEAAKNELIPLDLDTLVAEGVLEKNGAWYRILKPNDLPAHAKRKISMTRQVTEANG